MLVTVANRLPVVIRRVGGSLAYQLTTDGLATGLRPFHNKQAMLRVGGQEPRISLIQEDLTVEASARFSISSMGDGGYQYSLPARRWSQEPAYFTPFYCIQL